MTDMYLILHLQFYLYTSIEPHSQCFYAFKTPIYEGDTWVIKVMQKQLFALFS